MAATETQFMLSVGLIGEFHFTFLVCLFIYLVFKRSWRLRLSVRAGQSHDTNVIPKASHQQRFLSLSGSLVLHVRQYS